MGRKGDLDNQQTGSTIMRSAAYVNTASLHADYY